MKLGIVVCLAILLAGSVAQTADDDGRFAVKGAGLASCGDYTKAMADQSPLGYSLLGWLDGYLSAYNELSADTFDVASWESADLFARILDGHCGKNPGDKFFATVRSIVGQIAQRRLRKSSPLVPAQIDGQGMLIYEETLRRVQRELTEYGYYQGAIDGRFGAKTRAAIEAFQVKEGLKVTGLPDQVTLWKLFRSSAQP